MIYLYVSGCMHVYHTDLHVFVHAFVVCLCGLMSVFAEIFKNAHTHNTLSEFATNFMWQKLLELHIIKAWFVKS